MPKITIFPDGGKVAKAAGVNHKPPKREAATGWSKAAARRNADFLMSVDPLACQDGEAISVSLTFGREDDVTPGLFRSVREALFQHLRRQGILRLHWLAEFQRDGTPHFHMMVYYPFGVPVEERCRSLLNKWLTLAAFTGAKRQAQHIVPVTYLKGWKMYLAKHGARGVNHYQRQMPEGWDRPGRMWGYLGSWPTRRLELEVDDRTFFRYRRFVRSWRVARARQALRLAPDDRTARRTLLAARRSLVEGEPGSSARTTFRGLSQWIPEAVQVEFLQAVAMEPEAMVRRWSDRAETPTCNTGV